ncbi:MAG TPA: presqualene diphosphate synthase HpnD [Dehalococcoidia bacterium]|jgi:phytoene synthase|nr:presqualene diphosphate synthase HpnD [Chloroflexota bacterium]HIB10601.1 presqualene diphosphate synthase HpnD [Dehalococcoidia bacterium]
MAAIDVEIGYQESREITRREAKNFYYAFLTLPQERRRAIYVAYAFCRYCDDAVDTAESVDQKMATLESLHASLNDAYTGRTSDPLFLALADVADRHDIPEEYFKQVIHGVESDLTKVRYQDFEELRSYCYQVASVVGLICLQIFGYKDDSAREHAIDLGLAMQLTNIARDIQEDLGLGRIYLPQDEIARFGYSEEALEAGIVNESFIDLMRFQAQRARGYFDSGFKLLPYLSPRSRACPAVMGQLYSKVLQRIEEAEFDVFQHRISLSKTEKLRVTAQTWFTSMLPSSLR